MDNETKIIEAIKAGDNVLITGGAGTGKTFLQNKIVEAFEDKLIVRTALTGLASLHVNGQTIHKFTGIGINNHVDQLKFITKSRKFRTQTIYDIEDCDILFIDEVSMLRSDVLGLLDALFKYVMDKPELPFGGKQIVFAGDFMQLPPVVKRTDNLPEFWAFQSPVWTALNFTIINLTEVKRQTDKDFSNCLNWIRAGRKAMTPEMEQRVSNYIYATRHNVMPKGVEPIKLVSTNDESNRWNSKMLRNIDSVAEGYAAKVDGISEKHIETIIKDCPALQMLSIKVGAQVMTLKNDSSDEYINGSMGEYLGLENAEICVGFETDGTRIMETASCMKVKIFEPEAIVYVPKHTWKNEKRKVSEVTGEVIVELLASFEQYPVKLAYAITIHKSQGMSLDYLEVDFRNVFMSGQAYVALSRARKYEGLIVKNWSIAKVMTDPAAYDFYMGLNNGK